MSIEENSPQTNQENQSRRLELLLDVPLDLSVELGRTRMSIQDLLNLSPGSVVELDKIAGEPLDILVNDRLIARGEAVVVNDKFGVRITDIVSPSERIARLR
jgi:flagellar motor switch protein FliN/FliY